MKLLTTRNRIIIVTTLATILYLIIQEIDFRVLLDLHFAIDPVKPFILAEFVYIGTFWSLFFKVKGERLLTVLVFPAINVFAITLFSEMLIETVLSGVEQIGALFVSIIIFWSYTYITILTTNILNTAQLKEVPLEQAARAAQFVMSLITAYISFFLLFSNDIYILIRIASIGLIAFLLVYISLWTIELRKRQRFTASLTISFVLVFAGIILSIWPVSAPYLALVLSLLFYIFLGIALEIRDIISNSIWLEYYTLFVLIVILLVLVAEWGINGTLI